MYRLPVLLARLLIVALLAGLVSCYHGPGLRHVTERRGGMALSGINGGIRNNDLFPRFGPRPAAEVAVDAAILAGIEDVLSTNPYLDYVPFSQIRRETGVQAALAVEPLSIRYGRLNNLDLVLDVRVTRNLYSGRITINLLIQTARAKNLGLTMATAKSPQFAHFSQRSGPLTDPATLPLWRQTAAQVMREALAKVGG